MHSARFYCVLGGNDPGIFNMAPTHNHLTNLANAKLFPITIICTTKQEAEDVFSCQAIIDRLDLSQDERTILATFLESGEVAAVLRNLTRFYGVLVGMPVGIYLNYTDLEWIFATKLTRKLKKLDTFSDAITYLLTEGVFQTAATFLDDYRDNVESATTETRCNLLPHLRTAANPRSAPTSPTKSDHTRRTVASGSSQTITSSSSSSSSTPTPVYQHIRNLSGIVTSLARRPAIQAEDDASLPSLGQAADKYLSAHGYNVSAIHHIDHASNTSNNLQEFIGYLHPRGMAWTEIVYLWELIQGGME